MKKKHFLFTSLTIAAILSANAAQAEEVGTTPTEPEKELVTGEADKDVVLEEPKKEFSGELVEALNAEKPQEEHSLLRSMPENSVPTDNTADVGGQGKADSDLLEESRAEVPKTEEESKTITSGYSNSGTKGAFQKLTLKPGETIGGGLLGSDNIEYVLGSPNRLTYDEIEDGGTYLTAFYQKNDRRKISLASNLFSWLGYKLDQKSQDAVRAAIAKLLDEEMVDATRLLGGFELDATQETLVQSHYDKVSLALEKLKNGEDGASALPTFEEDRSFHALRTAGENGELAVKVKTLLEESKTITSGYSDSGTKGAFQKLTLKPGETIGGRGSDNIEYVLGSPNRLTYDEIEDGGTYLTAFYLKDERRKISLASNLFSWLGYKLDQKNQDAVRAAIAKLLDEEMVDATRLLGGFELDATQKTLVQSHYDKASLALEKLKNGEDGASALPTFEEDRSFHALRIAGEKGELAVKVKTLLSDQNGSQLTVETSPEDAVASLEVLAHIEPTEVNPSPIARLAGQDFDIYDIKLKDAQGQLVSTLKQNALVKLPVDSGKEVIKVIYLPETGEATELPILKQDKAFVYFETNHFSHYGIVYKTAEQSTPKQLQTQTGMDIEAIKNGDYSSLFGTWKSVDNLGEITFTTSSFKDFEGMAIGDSKQLTPPGNDKIYPIYLERRLTVDGHVEQITATSSHRQIDWKFVPKGSTYSLTWNKAENLQIANEDLVLGRMDGFFEYHAYRRSSDVPMDKDKPINEPPKPQTQTGMDIEAIKNGDYSSVTGVWRRIDETSNVVPYVMVSEHGFSANAEISYKDLKIGETRTVPERYTWTRQLDKTYGYPVDSIGFYRSEGVSRSYVPKGMSYSTLVWDNGAKTVTKVAPEDLIVEQGIGYHVAVYIRVTDIDNFYTISAGDYGMGTLVDSFGRSVVDSNYVVVTGQIGDTIDLNTVGGRFGREGKAIYRVTLSNGKDELTLPDYQSSFVLDETTKGYNKINIIYDTAMPKPKRENQDRLTDKTSKIVTLIGRGDITVSGFPSGAHVEVNLLPQVLTQWQTLANARKNSADFSEWTLVKVTDKDGNPYQGEVTLTYPIDGRLNRRVSDVVFLKDGETKATNHSFTTKDGYVTVVLPANGILEVAYLNGTDETDKNTPNKNQKQKSFTAEQELIAQVWKTVTGGDYPYWVVRKEANTPITTVEGSKAYPKVTYFIAEDTSVTKRSYAMSHEVTFSDNGDGTVTIYKVPKHWHMETLEEVVKYTQTILDTAQVIKLDELSKSETETIVKRATRYEGFSNGSSKNSTPQGQGNGKQTPAPQADLSTRRNQLLIELDKSPLTDEQKGQLAEKFAFANTEKELDDVTAEFKRLTVALGQESKPQTPQTPQKADAKATLPATGEAKPAVLAMIGAGLLLASLGLVYHRKRS